MLTPRDPLARIEKELVRIRYLLIAVICLLFLQVIPATLSNMILFAVIAAVVLYFGLRVIEWKVNKRIDAVRGPYAAPGKEDAGAP